MKIPNYVLDILERSAVDFDHRDCPGYSVGYSIKIRKPSDRTLIGTFEKELTKLVNWVNRQCPETATIVYLPTKTHYCGQVGVVTIYDPVMHILEKYISK